MKNRRIRVCRPPFFQVDGVWFVDLLWNFGHPLSVDMDRLANFLATAPAPAFVLGRRLNARQHRLLDEHRGDFEDEAFAFLFPRDPDRWG